MRVGRIGRNGVISYSVLVLKYLRNSLLAAEVCDDFFKDSTRENNGDENVHKQNCRLIIGSKIHYHNPVSK